ncbi:NADH-quinone oxidoreductase subunit C [Streptomyces sp. NPDC052236]|uniref:NADH-quinone oxidoreductase subunit C n=1 Tax=Streptomyces sp. NPDC052236 TaxID=3365686 RepID=UPI0037D57CF7
MTSSASSAPSASSASSADRYDRLPEAAAELFGEEATAERAYDLLTVDVPADSWIAALETARSELGCTYFDWLSAVDEPGTGFRVCAHVVALGGGRVRRLLVRTTVPHEAPELPTAISVYAGAGWHERETYEMFGVVFTDHPHLVPLLLPEGFEGHPLRKDFVLAARVAKAWPGAKEPGESEHGGPRRRQMLPPGVPDPNEWGPLKGQLPPAPARPARAARTAAAPGDRPPRRARSVSEGSASQTPEAAETPAPRPRRTQAAPEAPAPGPESPAPPTTPTTPAPPARSADAPWHHPSPAGDDATTDTGTGTGSGADASTDTGTDAAAGTDTPPTPRPPKTGSADGPPDEPTEPAGGDPA